MTNQILQERYEIQRQLGKNSGRKTLLAKDLETQELVVVKLLNLDNEFNWQDLKLFEREAQILQELSNPEIPKYLDYFDVDLPDIKGFALVQNYIPAKSLEEHLESGRTFSEAEVKQIAKAVLEVLIHLHSRQPAIIHRDIKPSNILLGDRSGNNVGDVYLIDFGAVKTTEKQGGTMTVVGTYGYMAQEQFGGRAVPASDLYGLGATLIYLVTGSHPADLLGDDMAIEFEKSVNLSAEFITWLKWMTQTKIKNRPSSAEAALKELENPTIPESQIVSNKPLNSIIKLIREKDKLKIISPPNGFSLGHRIIWLLLFFPSLFIIIFLIVGLLSALANGIFVLIECLIFLGPILVFMLYAWREIIFTGYVYTCISINRNNVQIKYQISGLNCFKSRPISNSDIYKLELVDEHIYDKATQQQRHLAQLTITAGIGNYELKNIQPKRTIFELLKIKPLIFTLAETYWLAKELSDFLNLPISRDSVQKEGDL
jgi:serine/threonine protein kinase